MITTSDAWKEYAKNNFIYHIKAVLTPSSGSALNLTDEDFMMGSVQFNDSTSDSNTFTIGGVITNTFNATLNNFSGKFDDINFDKATISVQLGIVFEDETEEWINKGVYTVDKPSSLGSTIQLTCYDFMDKLNTYYIGKRWKFYTPGDYSTAELIDIAFPQTAETMMQYICDYCHVSWDASSWDLGSFTVNEFEYDESTTCRQVLGWILQCCGGFAKMSPLGVIRCTWYNAKVWANETDLDGGLISDNGVWGASDTADGGTMWVAVASYDGGEMLSGASVELNKVANTTVGVDDIRITGVRAYANGTVDEFEFETVGSDGYIIALQDNPLITSDNMLAVATLVYNQVKDLQFRIFNLSAWASPDIEAGDSCLIQDYRGKVYPSIITNVTYNLNGLSDMSCGAETPGENSLEIANPQTQTIAGATRAAYDYVLAKKISADYITAGTLGVNGKITATDLEVTGGSINIESASDSQDIITLSYEYQSSLGKRTTVMRPTMFRADAIGSGGGDYYCQMGPSGVIMVSGTGRYSAVNPGQIYVFEQEPRYGSPSGISMSKTALDYYASGVTKIHITQAGAITCVSLTQTSLAELKKDIKKLDNALDIVQETDIYSYQFKEQEDDHIAYGAVIGDGYRCSEEIQHGDGIDTYSMVAILWKAVQEQQAQINVLKHEIEILKGIKDGNTN